jgi:phosphonate transport system substrate-binding protein
VNFGQSSNDVFPTTIHLAALAAMHKDWFPALPDFMAELRIKSVDFADVVKIPIRAKHRQGDVSTNRSVRESRRRMKTLRFGSFLAPSLRHVYEAVAESVGMSVGLRTEFVVERSYESFRQDVNEVSFICGLAYIAYEQLGISSAVPIAAPIPSGTRYGQQPVYFSDVIVHRDSPFRSFLDLRGRTWAYNERLSQSGCGITQHHLVTIGETDGFFDCVVETGAHDESIKMVRRGEVDGSAIDSHLLAIEMGKDPLLRRELRVVDVLGPSTIQPVVVSGRLSRELRGKIRDTLIGLHLDPFARAELQTGLIDRFVPVDAGSYDDIRQMVEACEAAEFSSLR